MRIRLLPLLLLLLAVNTLGANFTVTRNDDRNAACVSGTDCSLREAIAAANAASSDDTILFAAGVTTVTLDNTELTISNNGMLTIHGRGADVLTIDGGPGQNRIFYVPAASLTLRNLRLTGGNAVGTVALFNLQGGAIYMNAGQLTLDHVNVSGNTAVQGGAAGSIYFFAGFGSPNHRILNSTFSNNQTGTSCGAFYVSGGNTVTVVNSTVSGNTPKSGGAICNDGSLHLRNTTVTGNTGSQGGGGIYNGTNSFTMANTIIAGNTAPADSPEILNNGTITSLGNNLVGDSQGDSTATHTPITYQASDIRDTTPVLGPLAANGGQTPTMPLLTGSPAINAGNNAFAGDPSNANIALAADQRGYSRIAGPNVDIGAYEANSGLALMIISGRAMIRGRGAPGVILSLTPVSGPALFTLTNPFGYYRFKDLLAGEVYTLSASSKRAALAPTVTYISASNVTDVNFTAP